MGKIVYESSFKNHIQSHVDLKQAIGYKYETDADHLKRFDQFLAENYPLATSLTKEMVLNWCSKKSYEFTGKPMRSCLNPPSVRKIPGFHQNRGLHYSQGIFPLRKTICTSYLYK